MPVTPFSDYLAASEAYLAAADASTALLNATEARGVSPLDCPLYVAARKAEDAAYDRCTEAHAAWCTGRYVALAALNPTPAALAA